MICQVCSWESANPRLFRIRTDDLLCLSCAALPFTTRRRWQRDAEEPSEKCRRRIAEAEREARVEDVPVLHGAGFVTRKRAVP